MRAWLVCSIAALVSVAGCAASEEPSGAAVADRDCFSVRQVTGFNVQDDETLRLNVGAGEAYVAEIQGPACGQIEWTESLAIESRPSSFLCVGDGPGIGDIAFRDSALDRVITCRITALSRAPESAPETPQTAP